MSEIKVSFNPSDTAHSGDTVRRRLLKAAATGVGAISVLPGVKLFQSAEAKPDDQPVSSKNRWGLLIDTTQCGDGCGDCVNACAVENGWGKGSSDEQKSGKYQKAQWIRKVDVRDPATGREFSLPVMCQHCENPPCKDVCPTGASFRREDGLVMVDRHICIGCRYCMMACPYKARSFVHETLTDQRAHQPRGKGCVESCTLCAHRVDKGRLPACVEACTHGAMTFGDLNNPASEISQKLKSMASRQLREDLNLNTGVRYAGI